jgi:GTP-binding protein
MKFLDEAKIYLQSGAGGPGACSFRREKFVEFGGPDGGNGGRGGAIYFQVEPNLNTLIDFRYRQHFKAQRGLPGMGKDRHGKGGEDLVIPVPLGTQIMDEYKQILLHDFTKADEKFLFLKGGDGGFGNAHYKSSVNRAPRRVDPGYPSEEQWVWLRLKLLADVGLLGLPNAGKSTFLSVVSRAKPKIADYPFTTLTPNLGVVFHHDKECVVADVPGLIEKAHQGVGLGLRFLGHLERCKVLLHLIDGTQEDPIQAYRTIQEEIKQYGPAVADKPQMVVLNKWDSVQDGDTLLTDLQAVTGTKVYALSSLTREGLTPILDAIFTKL